MASRKTWLWIVCGALGAGLAFLIVAAGAGIYFVTHHIRTERASRDEATRVIESAKAVMRDSPPLYEVDAGDDARLTRPLAELPTSATKPEFVWIIAWDPDDMRLVRLSIPMWMLRYGRERIAVKRANEEFDLGQLNLDVNEIERIGPALLLDLKNRDGARVLVWTR